MAIHEEKVILRKTIKELQKKHSIQSLELKSEKIVNQLEALPLFKQSNHIMCYWSMPEEVSTHRFVQQYFQHKSMYLPLIQGDELDIIRFRGMETMVKNPRYPVYEPRGNKLNDFSLLELIIIPGLAFDRSFNRLGRGKGYYDKLLQQSNALKVGIAFNFQIVDRVPVEPHDIPLDYLITENEILKK